MTELWTAFDLTGLSTNTQSALVIGVGVTLLFLGYKLIKRTGRSF